jgi:hypothetical protein
MSLPTFSDLPDLATGAIGERRPYGLSAPNRVDGNRRIKRGSRESRRSTSGGHGTMTELRD